MLTQFCLAVAPCSSRRAGDRRCLHHYTTTTNLFYFLLIYFKVELNSRLSSAVLHVKIFRFYKKVTGTVTVTSKK